MNMGMGIHAYGIYAHAWGAYEHRRTELGGHKTFMHIHMCNGKEWKHSCKDIYLHA